MTWELQRQLQDSKYIIQQIIESGIKRPWIEYQALHVYLDLRVLIKTVDDTFKSNPDYQNYLSRLQTEKDILTQLSDSPYIIKLIDSFEEDNIYCLVTEFIEGESLLDKVKREGALAEKEALEYIHQVGSALTIIHNRGIVHRYINPANLLLRDNNQVVLTNFSLATEIVPCFNNLSNSSVFNVNLSIDDSEQVTGDIYSLAATLYFLVTGKNPVSLAQRKWNNQELISPQQVNSKIRNLADSISTRTNDAICLGMSLETSERPQTVEKWLEILIESYYPENLILPEPQENYLNQSTIPQSESIEIPNSLRDPGRWRTTKNIIYITLQVSIFTAITGALLGWMDAPGWAWWWTLIFSIARIAFLTNNLTLAMFFFGLAIAIWGAGTIRDGLWGLACFSGSLSMINKSWIALVILGFDILFGVLSANQAFGHILNLTFLGATIGLLFVHLFLEFLLYLYSEFMTEELLKKEGKVTGFLLWSGVTLPGLAVYWFFK